MSKEYETLIDSLSRDGYLKTPEIIDAFKTIDRKDFIPESLELDAYQNAPLPIGVGQTISQPLTVAFMLELLMPKVGEKILDVGTGSGWTTALLAHLISRGDKSARREGSLKGLVLSIERILELTVGAEKNIAKYNFIKKGVVKLVTGDGTKGYRKEAPFDKVLAGAAAQKEIPPAWKKQLKIRGRIVAPVGHNVVVIDKVGPDLYTQKEYFGFSFVPLING